jgi:hypothetical protein
MTTISHTLTAATPRGTSPKRISSKLSDDANDSTIIDADVVCAAKEMVYLWAGQAEVTKEPRKIRFTR